MEMQSKRKGGEQKNETRICYSCTGLAIFTSEMKQAGERPLCIGVSKKVSDIGGRDISEDNTEYQSQSSNMSEDNIKYQNRDKQMDDLKMLSDFYFACAGYSQTTVYTKRGHAVGMPVCDLGLNLLMSSSPNEKDYPQEQNPNLGKFPLPDSRTSVNTKAPLLFSRNQGNSGAERHAVSHEKDHPSKGLDQQPAIKAVESNETDDFKHWDEIRRENSVSANNGKSAIVPLFTGGLEKWKSAMDKNAAFMATFGSEIFDDFWSRYIASSSRIIKEMGRQSSYFIASTRNVASAVISSNRDDQSKEG